MIPKIKLQSSPFVQLLVCHPLLEFRVRYTLTALLLLAACGKGEDLGPPPYAGPPTQEGYSKTPYCGTAFVYEITEKVSADQTPYTCPDAPGPHGPATWKSPRYIRVDWKEEDGKMTALWTDGDVVARSIDITKSSSECTAGSLLGDLDGSTSDELLHGAFSVTASGLEGNLLYSYHVRHGSDCDILTEFTGRPVPY